MCVYQTFIFNDCYLFETLFHSLLLLSLLCIIQVLYVYYSPIEDIFLIENIYRDKIFINCQNNIQNCTIIY